MKNTVAAMFLLIAVSCSAPTKMGIRGAEGVVGGIASNASITQPLSVLSWTAGICLLAGVALLVITSGRKGKWALIAGGGMILLNYAVAKYDAYLFYPLVGFTFLISSAYTYRLIKQILMEKKKK